MDYKALIGISLILCSVGIRAQAAEQTETGLIVERTSGGFWASFAHPVAEGGSVKIRAFRDGLDVATAKIQWSSQFPPYEAYLIGLSNERMKPQVWAITPYQTYFNEKGPAGSIDRGEVIAPGFFVVAKAAAPGRTTDALRGLLDLLDARPEFRDYLREKGATKADWDDVHMILDNPLRVWNDPITARITKNLRQLLKERNNVQAQVPSFWFPPAEARKKTEVQGPTGGQ